MAGAARFLAEQEAQRTTHSRVHSGWYDFLARLSGVQWRARLTDVELHVHFLIKCKLTRLACASIAVTPAHVAIPDLGVLSRAFGLTTIRLTLAFALFVWIALNLCSLYRLPLQLLSPAAAMQSGHLDQGPGMLRLFSPLPSAGSAPCLYPRLCLCQVWPCLCVCDPTSLRLCPCLCICDPTSLRLCPCLVSVTIDLAMRVLVSQVEACAQKRLHSPSSSQGGEQSEWLQVSPLSRVLFALETQP